MTSAGGKWDLNPEAFARLLSCLSPDHEAAAREYERVHDMLLDFFTWRGCQNPGQEADETLDRVARRLEEGESVAHIHRYIHGVARRVFAESIRRRERERQTLAELKASAAQAATGRDEALSTCLQECLGMLPAGEGPMLSEYYSAHEAGDAEGRRTMAQQLGITYGALRVRVLRARGHLEKCLDACLEGKGFR